MSRLIRSFRFALSGLLTLIRTQPNARIHCVAMLAVLGLAVWFATELSRADWALLIVAICGVLAAEAFNTAIEFLSDAVHPEPDPFIGRAKDLAAGGVLIASLGAAGIGGIVFIPVLIDSI